MAKASYIMQRIGSVYLVWYQAGNSYFQLEEPAWFVFRKLLRRYKKETIAKEFSQRYGMALEVSITFVEEVQLKLKEQTGQNKLLKGNLLVDNPIEHHFEPHGVHFYDLGLNAIKFTYGTYWLKRYIHPLLEHLEVSEALTDVSHFELFEFDGKIVFKLEDQIKGIWSSEDSHLVKGKIFMELINLIHDKTDEDWLMTVHASAISNGKKTILFSAAPGSGKTTFAALLKSKGYHLISDDFVPIDKHLFHAFPIPIAMSVKEGAMKLLASHYPVLEEKQLNYISSEKSVRYLPVENDMLKMIFPVKEFIFIKYDDSVDFKFEK